MPAAAIPMRGRRGASVSEAYTAAGSRFTGRIRKVTVEVRCELDTARPEEHAHAETSA
jgi:hypothetical protein